MPTFSLRFLPILIAFCLLPCLFMGRAGAQTSPPVTSGLVADVDASRSYKTSAASTLCTALGDPVGAVLDSTGNGNSPVNSASATTQTYIPAYSGNGLPAISFNGAGYLEMAANSSTVMSSSTGTYFAVCTANPGAASSQQILFGVMPTLDAGRVRWYVNNQMGTATGPTPGQLFQNYGNTTGQQQPSTHTSSVNGNLQIYGVVYHPTTIDWYFNGRLDASSGTAISGTLAAVPGKIYLGGGNEYGGTATSATTTFQRFLAYNRDLSPSEIAQVNAYLVARYTPAGQLIFEGDSLTYGQNAALCRTYPALVLGALRTDFPAITGWLTDDAGVQGRQIVNQTFATAADPQFGVRDMTMDANAYVNGRYRPGIKNVVVMMAGTNDIYYFTQPAATVLANWKALYASHIAAGFVVVPVTLPPSTVGVTGTEAARQTLNAYIRTLPYCVDLGADATIGQNGQAANSTYYVDGTHFMDAGYAIVGGKAAQGVFSALTQSLGTKRKTQ